MKKTFLAVLLAAVLCSFGFGQTTPTPTPYGTGSGTGTGRGDSSSSAETAAEREKSKSAATNSGASAPLRINSKPRSNYTDAAREEVVEGVVRLRVIFLASGEIGSIMPVVSLPNGLTEQAIAAARKIKFEPALKNGVPVTAAKIVEYRFVIYFDENDKALARPAEILEMPAPESSADDKEIQKLNGKIKVSVELNSDRTARLIKIDSGLSKELIQKINDAVAKIKFNPAIHQNGKEVSQIKDIEYVFAEPKN